MSSCQDLRGSRPSGLSQPVVYVRPLPAWDSAFAVPLAPPLSAAEIFPRALRAQSQGDWRTGFSTLASAPILFEGNIAGVAGRARHWLRHQRAFPLRTRSRCWAGGISPIDTPPSKADILLGNVRAGRLHRFGRGARAPRGPAAISEGAASHAASGWSRVYNRRDQRAKRRPYLSLPDWTRSSRRSARRGSR